MGVHNDVVITAQLAYISCNDLTNCTSDLDCAMLLISQCSKVSTPTVMPPRHEDTCWFKGARKVIYIVLPRIVGVPGCKNGVTEGHDVAKTQPVALELVYEANFSQNL